MKRQKPKSKRTKMQPKKRSSPAAAASDLVDKQVGSGELHFDYFVVKQFRDELGNDAVAEGRGVLIRRTDHPEDVAELQVGLHRSGEDSIAHRVPFSSVWYGRERRICALSTRIYVSRHTGLTVCLQLLLGRRHYEQSHFSSHIRRYVRGLGKRG